MNKVNILQKKELENFNYFVRYIKKLICINHDKYGLETAGKIEYSSTPRFDSKHKNWNLLYNSSKTEYVFINKINGTNPIYKDITAPKAVIFKDKYAEFASKIINSLLNSHLENIKEIKKDFVRHIENKTEYSVYESSILGVFLHSNPVEIEIKNLNDKPAIIELIPVKIDEIESLIYKKPLLQFNLEYYGLKAKFKIDKTVGYTSYYENKEEHLLLNILKLFFVANTKVLNWRIYTEPKEAQLCSYLSEGHNYKLPFRKILKKAEVNLLLKYYKEFREYLIKHNIFNYLIYDRDLDKYVSNDYRIQAISPYSVAIEYYNEALDIPLDKPNKIISTIIMGLEALFTTPDCDLAYTLRMRITTLFNVLNIANIDALNVINKGYSVRSDYAHGGTEREKRWKKLLRVGQFNDTEECVYYFLNVLRISVLIALILENDNLDITSMQELIDSIMLGDLKKKAYLKRKLTLYKNLFKF